MYIYIYIYIHMCVYPQRSRQAATVNPQTENLQTENR